MIDGESRGVLKSQQQSQQHDKYSPTGRLGTSNFYHFEAAILARFSQLFFFPFLSNFERAFLRKLVAVFNLSQVLFQNRSVVLSNESLIYALARQLFVRCI